MWCIDVSVTVQFKRQCTVQVLIFKCNQFWSLNVTEHDPDYWAKDEELRLALVAAGEEFDYKVQNAKILLIHKVRHESLC